MDKSISIDYRYPVPKYTIFKDYILLSTGQGVWEDRHHSIKIPKELLLDIAKEVINIGG